MKVVYKKSVLEKISEAIAEAHKLGKVIQHIAVTNYEMDEIRYSPLYCNWKNAYGLNENVTIYGVAIKTDPTA